MAKRQIRISGNIISQKWPELSGKKVNIVLCSGSVLLVTLHNLLENQLEVKDMRFHKQRIALNQISEIIVDY